MRNFFRQKSQAELRQQTKQVAKSLGEQIIPQTELQPLKTSLTVLREKYPVRYKYYISALRGKMGEQEKATAISWLRAMNNLGTYINGHRGEESDNVLRERQISVFEDIHSHLEAGITDGYVKLPTGTGKTVLFSKIIESMNLKTLVVVPTQKLISQTQDKFEEFTEIDSGAYFQLKKDISKKVTVTTYASLIAGVRNGKINPSEYGLLVLDESHRANSWGARGAIEKFNALKLRFTATPGSYHPGTLLHAMSIEEAVNENLLCGFSSMIAYTTTDTSDVKIRKGVYDERELEKTINNKARNLSAVTLYKKLFKNETAVAFCGGVQHATDLAKLFVENGVSAEVISGTTRPDERDAIYSRFRQGKTKVLCNARLLIEGFDEPRASVALNLLPTTSRIDAEQRGGRVLRLDPNRTSKHAYIVDFLDEDKRFRSILFADVAGKAGVKKDETPTADTSKKGGATTAGISFNRKIEIEGLRVTVEEAEILRIVSGMQKDVIELTQFTKLKDAVQSCQPRITTSSEYNRACSKNGWLVPKQLKKSTYFRGWDDFLGREALNYTDVQSIIQKLGITTTTEYRMLRKKRSELPGLFQLKNMDGFSTWVSFFGHEQKRIWTLQELQDYARKHGVNSYHLYDRKFSREHELPGAKAVQGMPGFTTWEDFFNFKKENYTYADLKNKVRALGNPFTGKRNYKSKKPKDWPGSYAISKMPGFVSWKDFFGVDVHERSSWKFKDLQKAVLACPEVTGFAQYRRMSKSKKWPAYATVERMSEFTDWNSFFKKR